MAVRLPAEIPPPASPPPPVRAAARTAEGDSASFDAVLKRQSQSLRSGQKNASSETAAAPPSADETTPPADDASSQPEATPDNATNGLQNALPATPVAGPSDSQDVDADNLAPSLIPPPELPGAKAVATVTVPVVESLTTTNIAAAAVAPESRAVLPGLPPNLPSHPVAEAEAPATDPNISRPDKVASLRPGPPETPTLPPEPARPVVTASVAKAIQAANAPPVIATPGDPIRATNRRAVPSPRTSAPDSMRTPTQDAVQPDRRGGASPAVTSSTFGALESDRSTSSNHVAELPGSNVARVDQPSPGTITGASDHATKWSVISPADDSAPQPMPAGGTVIHASAVVPNTSDARGAHAISSAAGPSHASIGADARLMTAAAQDSAPVAVDRLASVVTSHIADRQWHVTLKLDPPELGHVRLDVSMRDEALSVRLHVASDAVRRMVEDRLPELRDALSQHDLRVAQTEIVVRGTDASNRESATAQRQDSPGERTSHFGFGQHGGHGGAFADGRPSPPPGEPRSEWSDVRGLDSTESDFVRNSAGGSPAWSGAGRGLAVDLVA